MDRALDCQLMGPGFGTRVRDRGSGPGFETGVRDWVRDLCSGLVFGNGIQDRALRPGF